MPELVPSRQIDELPISEMLLETLNRNCITRTEQLAKMSVCDLMNLPTVGGRRALELLAVLEHMKGPRPSVAPVARIAAPPDSLMHLNALATQLGEDDIDARDVRFGDTITLLGVQASLRRHAGSVWRGCRSALLPSERHICLPTHERSNEGEHDRTRRARPDEQRVHAECGVEALKKDQDESEDDAAQQKADGQDHQYECLEEPGRERRHVDCARDRTLEVEVYVETPARHRGL
ncbi:MAG TPA: hypothetical protein VE907_18295 [Gammaproteobacteria bacterium]|nr:hypothetical protein [Gammaproteobacteria bacterium]